jgi:hypothetical protein
MLGNSSVAAQLAASQEGLSSMELVSYDTPQNPVRFVPILNCQVQYDIDL